MPSSWKSGADPRRCCELEEQRDAGGREEQGETKEAGRRGTTIFWELLHDGNFARTATSESSQREVLEDISSKCL
jgi:hypothetical protein